MENNDYQRCSKTVMDNIADPNITFDSDGVCNYWHDYQEVAAKGLIHGEEGKRKWEAMVQEMKEAGKNKAYDCILGVSGGVDSTFTAYLVKQAGLRPLLVHFDNGWNSNIAVSNIQRIVEYLGFDLFTLVVDWNEFRDLQRAYIKAGVVDIEALTDHAIFATLDKLAAKNGIKYWISGNNIETEQVLPKAWIFPKGDGVNILDIHKKFGSVPLKTYPVNTPLKKKYYRMKKQVTVAPINWMRYNKKEVLKLIEDEIGWQNYGGKHHESVFTKFYQNYILPTKFGIDKRKAHLSNLICSNQMAREEALKELEEPLYDPVELEADKEFVIKKLGFTAEEFDAIMKEEPRSHYDFETESPIAEHYKILRPFKKLYRMLRQ